MRPAEGAWKVMLEKERKRERGREKRRTQSLPMYEVTQRGNGIWKYLLLTLFFCLLFLVCRET